MNLFQKQHPKTVVGLTLDGSRLEAVLLRRTNGSAEIVKSHTGALTLDLLHNEVELVGREIRNQLEGAGIRERRCVAGVPASWVLTHLVKLPEGIEEADVESFLALEAERGFPCAVEDLQVTSSRFETVSGARYVMQLGVRRVQLDRLEQVLTAAQLKPAAFSLGLLALPEAIPTAPRGAVTAVVGESSVDVLLAAGGVASVRSLEGAFDSEGGAPRVHSDVVARELRITLGQLPEELRAMVHELNVLGGGLYAEQLVKEIAPRARALGLEVRHVNAYPGPQHGMKLPVGAAVSSALSIAAEYLGRTGRFEFLPPKPSMLQLLAARYSSRRLALPVAVAGAAAVIVLGLFVYQQFQLSNLREEWRLMKPKVAELEDLQAQIRKYRPWYDETFTSLMALQRVTEAFPVEPSVSAKTFEIRAGKMVSVSGTARDNQSLLRTLDQLRTVREVTDVKVDTIRGKSPMQFTFNFNWTPGGNAP
jgi:hypothetical protein